jgi:hypothetical protein
MPVVEVEEDLLMVQIHHPLVEVLGDLVEVALVDQQLG